MACKMSRDATGLFDVLGGLNQTPTVFIKSDASLVATVTAATLNGVNVPIAANGRMTLPALQVNNLLNLILVGVAPGNDIHLMEDCPNNQTADLITKLVGNAPAGANPNMGFIIHAK